LLENNKLIAEFMKYPDLGTKGDFSYLNYHKSWDCLKPVVQEVKQVHEGVPKQLLHLSLFSTRAEVYQAVVEFIKWYNSDGKVVYPFNEGDDYWTIEDRDVVWSCWDSVSEELYDENPSKKLFKTEQEALDSDRFICGVCGDHVNEYTYNKDKDVDECNNCKI
jgi:hypothetical protein